jgi:branched-chain amino acid transport system permease protein
MDFSEDTVLLFFEIIDVIISGLTNGSVYALLAVGMTLVYGVTKAFNFAYGELFNLGGYFAWTLIAIVGFGGGYVAVRRGLRFGKIAGGAFEKARGLGK